MFKIRPSARPSAHPSTKIPALRNFRSQFRVALALSTCEIVPTLPNLVEARQVSREVQPPPKRRRTLHGPGRLLACSMRVRVS
jgi:hypothetical protein